MCKKTTSKEFFPALKHLAEGKMVYFDNAATVQKPKVVIEGLATAQEQFNFPVNRSLYPAAALATDKVNAVRQQILAHLQATKGYVVVFCASATDAINLVAASIDELFCGKSANIVLSNVEHHSNIAPWLQLANSKGFEVKFVAFPARGFFLASDFLPQLTAKAGILAITLDSNVLGPVWQADLLELQSLIATAQSKGYQVLLDAAQAIAHQLIDLSFLEADFLVFSGHKFGAPHGVGALVAKKTLLEKMSPWRVGGGSVNFIDQQHFALSGVPDKFEAGSLPVAPIIALGHALSFLEQHILPNSKNLATLCAATIAALQQLPGITILGDADLIAARGHMVSFVHATIPAHDIAWSLGQNGFCVRAGFHCAQLLHQQFGLNGSVRISFFMYNDLQEVQQMLEALRQTMAFFSGQNHE